MVFCRRRNAGSDEIESRLVRKLLYGMAKQSAEEIEFYRDSRQRRLLQYAGQHCPYYARLFRECGFDAKMNHGFHSIPLLDKHLIRKNEHSIISDELSRISSYHANTGGSTGEPLDFYASSVAGEIDALHQEFVFRTTMGYEPGDRIAGFGGKTIPDDLLKKRQYWVESGRPDLPYGREVYSSLYLRAETIPYYIEQILKTSPRILRGYPSFLTELATYMLEHNISMAHLVKGIQLSAENAFDWQIEAIKKAFKTNVYLQYGHSVVSVYAYTFNETQEYVCSPYYGLVEVLGDDGGHVPVGAVGEVVVTGFHNRAMPFIRYRTGDMALYNGVDRGLVRLGKIVGRTQDYVYTLDRQKVALTALVFGQHFDAFRAIRKWQLQQDRPGQVKVRIVKDENYSAVSEAEISEKFASFCGIETSFEYVDHIDLTARGKYRFIIQNINMQGRCAS